MAALGNAITFDLWALDTALADITWGTPKFWLNTDRPSQNASVNSIGAGDQGYRFLANPTYIPDYARDQFRYQRRAGFYHFRLAG